MIFVTQNLIQVFAMVASIVIEEGICKTNHMKTLQKKI